MLKVEWVDGHREPKCQPNAMFPNGTDVDVSAGATRTCSVEVPYPAKRCGMYIIYCDKCDLRIGATTAGRIDDPRKITMACYSQKIAPNPPGLTKIALPDTPEMKRTPHVEESRSDGPETPV